MNDMMQWLLMIVVGYTFISTWIISRILDRILNTLNEMEAEMERMRRNP